MPLNNHLISKSLAIILFSDACKVKKKMGIICPPPVGIGLTDIPNIGGSGLPAPGSGITEFDIDCDIWTELPLPSPFICANAIFLV